MLRTRTELTDLEDAEARITFVAFDCIPFEETSQQFSHERLTWRLSSDLHGDCQRIVKATGAISEDTNSDDTDVSSNNNNYIIPAPTTGTLQTTHATESIGASRRCTRTSMPRDSYGYTADCVANLQLSHSRMLPVRGAHGSPMLSVRQSATDSMED